MDELWKPIAGYEGLYEVSNLGRVRSLGRVRCRSGSRKVPTTTKQWHYKPRILKPIKMHNYLKVNLHTQGNEQHQFLLSHLVANAFILPRNTRATRITYKDNDYRNCSVANLDVKYVYDYDV